MATEVEKLAQRLEDKGVINFHVSLAENCTATGEEIAAEINRVEDWLQDPVNRLTSRLRGEAFVQHDASQQRTRVLPGGVFEPVQQTAREKSAKRLGDLLVEAAEMLERFATQPTEIPGEEREG